MGGLDLNKFDYTSRFHSNSEASASELLENVYFSKRLSELRGMSSVVILSKLLEK